MKSSRNKCGSVAKGKGKGRPGSKADLVVVVAGLWDRWVDYRCRLILHVGRFRKVSKEWELAIHQRNSRKFRRLTRTRRRGGGGGGIQA